MNAKIIRANFSQTYRKTIAQHIKKSGLLHTEEAMIAVGTDPSFVKAICKSILRKEGW